MNWKPVFMANVAKNLPESAKKDDRITNSIKKIIYFLTRSFGMTIKREKDNKPCYFLINSM